MRCFLALVILISVSPIWSIEKEIFPEQLEQARELIKSLKHSQALQFIKENCRDDNGNWLNTEECTNFFKQLILNQEQNQEKMLSPEQLEQARELIKSLKHSQALQQRVQENCIDDNGNWLNTEECTNFFKQLILNQEQNQEKMLSPEQLEQARELIKSLKHSQALQQRVQENCIDDNENILIAEEECREIINEYLAYEKQLDDR